MHRLPVLIEVVHSASHANVQICRKMMPLLFKSGVTPLPFASSAKELQDVLRSLRVRNLAPSVFIVNTFWAEELLEEIDGLIGHTPALFFRREIFGDTMGLEPQLAQARSGRITSILRKMTPRPTAYWDYGSGTCDSVAQKASQALFAYLQTGDFMAVAGNLETRQGAFMRALAAVEQNRFGGNWDAPKPSSASSARMRAMKATGETTRVAPVPRGVHGTIEQLGLSTLLMMLEMEKKSGILVLDRPSEMVRVYVRNGRIVDAGVETTLVDPTLVQGVEAIYYALKWQDGQFDFTPGEVSHQDVIGQPMTSILMEGARRMDEVCKV
jgi:hypothetical protein